MLTLVPPQQAGVADKQAAIPATERLWLLLEDEPYVLAWPCRDGGRAILSDVGGCAPIKIDHAMVTDPLLVRDKIARTYFDGGAIVIFVLLR